MRNVYRQEQQLDRTRSIAEEGQEQEWCKSRPGIGFKQEQGAEPDQPNTSKSSYRRGEKSLSPDDDGVHRKTRHVGARSPLLPQFYSAFRRQ